MLILEQRIIAPFIVQKQLFMEFVRKKNITILICIFIFLFASSNIYAQTSILDQFSPSIINLYSKSINLFRNSSFNDGVVNGSSLTILFQDNDFYARLTPAENDLLFNQLNKTAIDNFFSSYLIEKKCDYISLLTQINTDGGKSVIQNKLGESLQFTKHMNTIMIYNPNKFELNVVGNSPVYNSIFYFL